ncbi:MAG: radical SAM protein, partial [Firmicutes bacterium]|nr:radical SAM protein [Bacillota bacterium]
VLTNFFINASLVGLPTIEERRQQEGCNIPWAILMDPTAACNLKCKGCWAAEYNKIANLSYETIDRIVSEGKELGMYMYLFSGGEPFLRIDDIVKLARKHNDCIFLPFTNGTLIDEAVAEQLVTVGNIVPAISIEGFEVETDLRRGKNTFKKAIHAMDILHKYGVVFGFSTCYHSQNAQVVGSDDYVDFLIDKGCYFGWYFTYMPLGENADLSLLTTPEQRKYMYHQVRKFRAEKPIFLLDFWNDGEYVHGCIAGGRKYFHINANGDAEPCAFIHYSDRNINQSSLLEVLKSPLFQQYSQNQPFNDNHLRPCPLLDNPDKLRAMVQNTQASSTQMLDLEQVEALTDKCHEMAKAWAPVADEIWHTNKDTD